AGQWSNISDSRILADWENYEGIRQRPPKGLTTHTTKNSNTTTATTAAQWDWKRHALTVPLEAFVSFVIQFIMIELISISQLLEIITNIDK
ncbi:hypothetical protein, partial [Vibrio vulnificus]|uniref:hypothetical protein n=1 Tax=Vibrio vulnificus TaxID=672 RepID=UPI001CDCDDC2